MDANDIFESLLTTEGRSDPYPLYAALHRLGGAAVPVTGAVIVHGYHAIDAVLRDPGFRVTDAARLDEVDPGWRDHPSLAMHAILNLNPPDHSRIRAPMARAFTKRRMSGLGPSITRMTDDLLEVMAESGAEGSPVEFMHDFAFMLPVAVICELLGIPEADRAGFRPLARDLAATVEVGVDLPVLQAADVAAVRLHEYLLALAAERRADPRDDLISALVAISEPGSEPEITAPVTTAPVTTGSLTTGSLTTASLTTGPGDAVLSAEELLDNLSLLLVAGFETTTNLLGNGLRVILQQPAVGEAIRDGSVPVPAFVEEVLRYDSPVQLTSRRRADAVDVGGVPMPGGTEVITLLGAGNRDPRRFAGPDTFDPLRPDGATLSFGAGAHFCLGAALARLEGAIAFPRLLRRFPRLAAAGEPTRRTGLVLRGFETLPVTVT
jgi:cytochrome P450